MSPRGAGGAAPAGRGSYLDTLDLQRPPFGPAAEPAFFYAEPTLMQRLDLLVHLAQFSDRILVLTGPTGAGKTSLLQQFMGRASENWRVCAMDSSEIPHRNALLARLASCFGAAGKTKSTEVDVAALLDRWSALQSFRFIPMLVIDDAHKLNGGTIEALLNLAGDPARTAERVRVILLGESDLLARMSQAGLNGQRDHLVHIMTLPALTAEQTAAYLAYRLAVAGYSGESPFPPSEAHAIHKAAGGRPGRINKLAHQYLEEHMATAGKSRTAGSPRGRQLRRWLLVSLGVAAMGLVLWKQNAINQLFTPGGATKQKTVALKLPTIAKEPHQDHSRHALPAPTTADAVPPAAGTPPTAPPSPLPAMTNPTKGPVGQRPPAHKNAIQTTPHPAGQDTNSHKSGAPIPLATSVASASGAGKPASTSPAPPTTAAALATPAGAHSEPAHRPAPAAKPTTVQRVKPAKAPRQESASIPVGGPLRATWLLQQNPKAYTVQVLGARDEASVRRFRKAHDLGKQAIYYAAEFKGSPWYVLLYGVYPDITAAQHGLRELPPKVRGGGPWIRRMAAVQHDIRQYRENLSAAHDRPKAP